MQELIKYGITIPYYNNSPLAERAFQKLMRHLSNIKNKDCIFCIVEDGQYSDWLDDYKDDFNIIRLPENKGVSVARNTGIDYLFDKVEYLGFLDSDDDIDDDYFDKMVALCNGENEVVKAKMFKHNHFNNSMIDITERVSVNGYAYRKDIIGDLRFQEGVQLGEDNIFNDALGVVGNTNPKPQEILCDTKYIYEFGANDQSLIVTAIRNSQM